MGQACGRSGQASCPPGSEHRRRPTWVLGAAPGYHGPREEKDWCLDKDWFQGLWPSKSLCVPWRPLSPGHSYPPPPPTPDHSAWSDPPASHLPTEGCAQLGPTDSHCGNTDLWDGATPWNHLPSPIGPHCGPSVGAIFNPRSPNPWVGAQSSEFWAHGIMGDLPLRAAAGIQEPREGLPLRLCPYLGMLLWGHPHPPPVTIQQPNPVTSGKTQEKLTEQPVPKPCPSCSFWGGVDLQASFPGSNPDLPLAV